jgi:hypothetical protein
LTEKILFWQNKEFIQFGLARKLQEKTDYELFALVDDVTESLKKFFQNQKTINFSNIWYYTDHAKISNKSPDIEYLKNIEKKYEINLWQIAYADRIFYPQFNKYHKFTENEILHLLEQECRFYEKILSDNSFNFLIIPVITKHHAYLLYEMAKAYNVSVLTYESTHFGDKWIITDEIDKIIDLNEYLAMNPEKSKSIIDMQNYLKEFKPDIYGRKDNPKYTISKWDKVKAASKFLSTKPSSYEKHYSSYGKNKTAVLKKGTARKHNLDRKEKDDFLNSNCLKEIPSNSTFVYFPLAYEPERALLLGAPFHSNQISVITNIAKSLPVGYDLYVKEHPGMVDVGWRDLYFYKQILDLPNVKLVHPNMSHENLIKQCSLVITIRGTAGLEAAFFAKPSIVFSSKSGYSELPSVTTIKNYDELPAAITSSLNKKVNPSDLSKYVDYMEKVSVDYQQVDYTTEFSNRFGYGAGFLSETNISENDLISFLDEYDQMFERLSSEYIKKIKNLLSTSTKN